MLKDVVHYAVAVELKEENNQTLGPSSHSFLPLFQAALEWSGQLSSPCMFPMMPWAATGLTEHKLVSLRPLTKANLPSLEIVCLSCFVTVMEY